MVARITRLLLLVQFLFAVAIFAALKKVAHVDSTGLALVLSIAAILAVRMGITANNFLLAAHSCSPTPAQYRIGVWQGCKLFASEFRATMLSSSWTMPFFSFAGREANEAAGLPVLLIHGYGCNSGYWHSMSKALLKAGITHRAVSLEPVAAGIDDYVPQVDDAVERLCMETNSNKAVVVAHSMGGLVARAYLRDHGSSRIARVVTLGTPHHGTALARFGFGLNTQQMRWTALEQEGIASDWLCRLAAGEDPSARRLFVSIYSHHDNIISPQTSSRLEGADNIEVNAVGHVALALDGQIQAMVIREVLASSRDADRAEPVSAGKRFAKTL